MKNRQEKNLIFGQAILMLIIFVFIGVTIVSEKGNGLLSAKVEEKMNTYISTNYTNIKNILTAKDVTYKNDIYQMKVTSKENKNHYFYINYSNRKITDTYEEDYKKGKSLYLYLKPKLEKEIESKTNTKCQIEFTSPLDEYTEKVQEKIIQEDNLLSLKIYTLNKELIIEDWSSEKITSEINTLLKTMNSNSITPKYYEITITNKKDITESIKITNITESFLTNPLQKQIMNDIINNNNSKLLKDNKIKFRYLN